MVTNELRRTCSLGSLATELPDGCSAAGLIPALLLAALAGETNGEDRLSAGLCVLPPLLTDSGESAAAVAADASDWLKAAGSRTDAGAEPLR